MLVMSYGEPQDVPGLCNARLSIGDNFGDNHSTMLCQLEPGHAGLHQEMYTSRVSGQVTVTWEHHDTHYDVSALEDAIEKRVSDELPTADRDWEFETPNDQGECITVYHLDDRKIGYQVTGKDSVTIWRDRFGHLIKQSTPLSGLDAIEAILAVLRGPAP